MIPTRPTTPAPRLPRREFIRTGAALAATSLLGVRAAGAPAVARAPGRARNVILCIADGVSQAHYNLGRAFKGTPLVFESWHCGALATAAADSFISDSAAAGSAIATGHRTRNGAVSVDGQDRPRRTILEAARDAGRATGLVVTGGFTTATAAVFAAHSGSRKASTELARQMVQADLTVMLGGGRDLLDRSLQASGGTSMGEHLRTRGYALPTTAAALAATPPGRTFGLFAAEALRPVIDRPLLAPTEPMLPAMTRHALRSLDAQPNGFFLMVEGTQTDWAGHQNDPAMLVHELLEFDRAVAEVQAFAAGRDDTLVIVLSDHGCGGLALGNARAQADRRGGLTPESLVAPLRGLSTSAVTLWEKHGIGAKPDAETVQRVLREHWKIALSEAQADEILLAAKNPHRDEDCDGVGRVFSRDFTYLDWTTHEHTAEDVPLYAWGPGAPRGPLHLTEIAGVMSRALDVKLEG